MKWKALCLSMVFVGVLMPVFTVSAGVHMTVTRSLDLKGQPLRVVTGPDGKYFFVLTSGGKIFAYDESGTLQSTCHVAESAKRIQIDPDGKNLLVISKEPETVQVVALEFFVEINTQNAPALGPEDASVTVVVFSDFQCPYCSRLDPLLNGAFKKYEKNMRLVFKNYPLRSHKFAKKAAIAALAADRQGKFWEFHDQLFKHSKNLSDQKIKEIARDQGLNEARFQADIKDPEIVAKIEMDYEEGKGLGVRGIPTVFINGKRVNSRELQDIQRLISAEIKRVEAGNK